MKYKNQYVIKLNGYEYLLTKQEYQAYKKLLKEYKHKSK